MTAEKDFFEEVQKKRRPCEGFLRHRPGWCPIEHKNLLQNKLERCDKIGISATSAIGAAILAESGCATYLRYAGLSHRRACPQFSVWLLRSLLG
jgi:hypothetical protein